MENEKKFDFTKGAITKNNLEDNPTVTESNTVVTEEQKEFSNNPILGDKQIIEDKSGNNTFSNSIKQPDTPIVLESEDDIKARLKKELVNEITAEVLNNIKRANPNQSVADDTKDALMLQILQQIADTQTQNIQGQKDLITLQKKRQFGIRSIDQSEIDPTDILQKPLVFFAWGFSTVVSDDFVNGTTIQPPYGRAISFRHLYRMKTSQGKFSSYCYAMIYSKKQAEFLRKHSDFNIRLFESLADAQSVENEYMTLIIAANDSIKRMSQHEVLSAARANNVSIDTMDMSLIKSKLLDAMVKKMGVDFQQRVAASAEKEYGDKSLFN